MRGLLGKTGRLFLTYGLLAAFFLTAGCACRLNMDAKETRSPEKAAWQDSPNLAGLFYSLRAQFGLEGTFVLYDRGENMLIGYNRARANTRYQPASTFKILNALIAFETGVVKDQNEILPYDGSPRPVKAWEKDMSITEAMAVSNVPLFQGIARGIGLTRMQKYVSKVGYGNAEIGAKVDDFWLKGPLGVSALEQIRFLDELTRGELPFSTRSVELLREIMPREEGRQSSLIFYKTGRTTNTQPGIGWVVGWVRMYGRDYPFALNLDINKDENAELRMIMLRQALQELGMY